MLCSHRYPPKREPHSQVGNRRWSDLIQCQPGIQVLEPVMNSRKLFVGNLTYSVREEQLKALFSRFGEVVSVRVLEKKGYGFVEMATPEQAGAAREALSETEFEGRNLLIDGVRPPLKSKKSPHKPRPSGSSHSSPGSRPAKPGSGYGYRGKKPNPSGHGGRPGQRSPSNRRPSMPSRRNTGSGSRRS
ncbi:RNA-binding protein [uncultured Methanospirillum sp.]|uniref:RNA recognition motif domain-containing protein n=1 Tax=uncultured Methanospirillum sp. TaxID=262503 RepID=UPI0029C8D280|nr:RNA-binding protein [uncultured Methanospirillum sp.]